jgi:hypothetical protein
MTAPSSDKPHPSTRAAWQSLAAVAIGLLLIDVLIAATAAPSPEERELDRHRVDALLRTAADDAHPFLLIGDSVLAGDVLVRRTGDPHAPRVIDALRRDLHEDDPATFHQVALDGVLLPDVLAVLERLDEADPDGRVSLVVEVNVRQLSPAYADTADPAHGWLQGPTSTWDTLRRFTPVLRHRDRFPTSPWRDQVVPPPTAAVDDLEARARLASHYRTPDLRAFTAPMQALHRIVGRLRQKDRAALFFLTPLEDTFVHTTLGEEGMGRVGGELSRVIDGDGRGRQRFVSLDHPLFGPDAFLDHCHLTHTGTDRLAGNLLELLDRRVRRPLPGSERAFEEDDDATLLTQLLPGARDGPPWQARLRQPDGVAVSDDRRRVVIADTGNHLLRELVGDLRTLRTAAGRAGQTGHGEGPARTTPLTSPRSPVIIGDRVYFLAGSKRDELWQLDGDEVRAVRDGRRRRIRHLTSLKAIDDRLLTIDITGDLWEVTPGGDKRLRIDSRDGRLTAVARTADGVWFVADDRGRLWRSTSPSADRPLRLPLGDGAEASGFALLADNGHQDKAAQGRDALPNARNATFPLAVGDVRLAAVTDLHAVERYGGVLIVGEADRPPDSPLEEVVHLRLLDPTSGLLYPWVRPRVSGAAHIARNQHGNVLTTPFRRGAHVLHPGTGALFSLERERGRLTVINDGLWGLTRIGHTPSGRKFNTGRHELFASRAGAGAHARFLPEQHLGARFARQDRAGPYVVLFVASSLSTLSDRVGMLPLGRQLERRWRRHHAAVDHLRLHVVQRAIGGPTLGELVGAVEQHLDAGGQPDVILLELGDALDRLLDDRTSGPQPDAMLDGLIARAEQAGALLLGLDVTPLDHRHREGPLAPRPAVDVLRTLLTARGVPVVDDNVGMLRASLDVAPMGSVPYASSHASPWAMAAAGERLADRLYPRIRRHVAGRPPQWQTPPREVAERVRLRDTLPSVGQTALDDRAVMWSVAGGTLEVFVDLAHTPAGSPAGPALAKDALRHVVAADPSALLAKRVRLRLARFSSYDEYGAGAAAGAAIVWERAFDAEGAGAFLRGDGSGDAR